MWLLALSQEREEVRLSIGRADSTIDRQNHSIDKDGVLTREKRNYACDFIRLGGSTDREARNKRCHDRFAFLKISSGLIGGETRCHGVDPHATRAVLQRQSACEVRDGALRCVIGTHPPISAETGRGGEVDDGTLRC